METLYITHPECRLHDMGSWHPESPQRLDAISDRLLSSGLMSHLHTCDAQVAGLRDILRVHTPEYLEYLQKQTPRHGYRSLDDDTAMNLSTLAAAWAAAGAGITAVDAIMQRKADTAFCAIRPPGHHARPSQAMGFCFFNNVAIAAAYALEKYQFKRVAIIDFDVHHGNGTEEIFENDQRVLMCSFFQHSLFPATQGQVSCATNMLNVPVPAGTPAQEIRAIVSDQWMPRLKAFAPEMLFISAGFDAHAEDDMGQLTLTEADFAWITQQIVDLADFCAQGRVVSVLEGGYSLSALGRSVAAHIKALSKL